MYKRFDTRISDELQEIADEIAQVAIKSGLDFYPTIFEAVDYQQLNEIASYGGFPTRYPHWRFGMEYERLSKSYTYGLSIIYEMVINNNPCYAYLLRSNSLVYQKAVIAHVYAHCDFFKNNIWFSKTNRKMLDQMANHASIIKGYIEEIGHDTVEDFIDCCLSLENLIDIYSVFDQKLKDNHEKGNKHKYYRDEAISKLPAKKYMDSYINPKEFLEKQKQKKLEDRTKSKKFPTNPQRDVLKFLIDYAPLSEWQKMILGIIRDESYYFAPQGQTKILNEGWATYWHSLMMTKLYPLKDSEIIDYCEHYAGVVYSSPMQFNPYKLGVELLRHIEERWDKGRFGLEYVNCDNPKIKADWDKKTGLGKQKIFEVRKFHNDITFIDDFLDEEFCHKTKLFLYDYDSNSGKYIITSRDLKAIKAALLARLTNLGNPIIYVEDGNFRNRGELLLEHKHEGMDLKYDYAIECLKNIYKIWGRPCHVSTMINNVKTLISFDGQNYMSEKI